MNIATPRFRSDLIHQPLREDGRLLVEITDPDSGDSFRFYEVEYYVAAAMDGTLDVAGLQKWSVEELGLEPPAGEIERLIRTLDDLGYLEGSQSAGSGAPEVEMGLAGGTPEIATAPMQVADVELGLAGSMPPPSAQPTPVESMDLELGTAGKSELTPARPQMASAPDVELGVAGKALGQAPLGVPAPPALSIPAPPVTPPAVVPAASPGADELSFAGLMDDDAKPEQPVPAEGDFGLDGLTPPPAEVPIPSLKPRFDSYSDDDGPTNLPPAIPIGQEPDDEVSVDLSAHLDIGVGDVKAAVRASQVMSAVDVPAELLAELGEDTPPEPPDVAAAPLPGERAPAAVAAASVPEIAAKPAGATPIELPDERAAVSQPVKQAEEIAPPMAKPRGAGLTIFLSILLIGALAGGGYYYYTQVLNKDDKKKTRKPVKRPGTPGKVNVKPTVPKVPVKPTAPPPKAKLVQVEAQSAEVLSARGAVLEWLADNAAEVNVGDVIAKYKGVAKLEARAAGEQQRKAKKYQPRYDAAKKALDKATAADNKAQIKRFERAVAAAQRDLDRKDRESKKYSDRIPPLLVKATVAGTFKRVARPRGYVGKGKPIGTIGGLPSLEATFSVKASSKVEKYTVGAEVNIHAETDATQKATCKITKVEGEQVSIRCAGGGPISAGTDVILE